MRWQEKVPTSERSLCVLLSVVASCVRVKMPLVVIDSDLKARSSAEVGVGCSFIWRNVPRSPTVVVVITGMIIWVNRKGFRRSFRSSAQCFDGKTSPYLQRRHEPLNDEHLSIYICIYLLLPGRLPSLAKSLGCAALNCGGYTASPFFSRCSRIKRQFDFAAAVASTHIIDKVKKLLTMMLSNPR